MPTFPLNPQEIPQETIFRGKFLIEKYKPKLPSLNYFYNQVTNKIKIQEYMSI
jgi:hypothetical protein